MELAGKKLTFTSLRHKEGYIEECSLLLKLQKHLGDVFKVERTENIRAYGKFFCCDFVCYMDDAPIFFLELKARNGITDKNTLIINDAKLKKCITRAQTDPTMIIFIWKNKDVPNQYYYMTIDGTMDIHRYYTKEMNKQDVRFIPKSEMHCGGIKDLCSYIMSNYK